MIPPAAGWVNSSSAELSLLHKPQGEVEVCTIRGLISKGGLHNHKANICIAIYLSCRLNTRESLQRYAHCPNLMYKYNNSNQSWK